MHDFCICLRKGSRSGRISISHMRRHTWREKPSALDIKAWENKSKPGLAMKQVHHV
ncbi:hypothetical protein ACSS6W_001652 [Trichoderma asperelloides]